MTGGKEMYLFKNKKLKSFIAGAMAAVILVLPLTGCQDKALSSLLSSVTSPSSLSSLINQVSSQLASSQPASKASSKQAVSSAVSKAASKASSSRAASSKVASSAATVKPKQQVQSKKVATTKVETGNQTVKKIAIDQSTQTSTRLAVTQSKPAPAAYSHVDQRSGYNYLTDSASKNLYNQILQSVYKVTLQPTSEGYYPTERIVVSNSHLTEAQLRVAMMAVLNDNPQIFWLANVYSYGYSASETYVQLYSVVSQSQCNTMIQQMNAKVSSVINSMPSGLSELDRELFLANYLVKHNVYDTAAVTDNTRWKAFTSYGALVDGQVVCEGYSRAMQLLSSYAGLQCILLTGQSDGVNHMWNVIRIGGNWYHLDNTWDDNDPTIYNYFNVTDTVIKQSHNIFPTATSLTEGQIEGTDTGTPAGMNLAIPTCISTEANYFRAKGIAISDLGGSNDSAAVSAIVSAANSRQESISFYVPESADYDQIMNGMLKASPYKLVTYINEANRTAKNKISMSGIRYIQDPSDRGLTVFLNYQ